mmetsp:Transcript_11812/g.24249  ORF Transcript_11812/g.24249 Transcript_11812/m.24249 type:complete len:1067 (-) Transcript_11812:337-3537(-)
MEHTYLRYECADSFGLATSSASSKAPQSNSALAFLASSSTHSSAAATLLTTAGSHCIGWNLKTCQPVLKLGHRETLTGGVGTGRALNSDELVCLDAAVLEEGQTGKVATGWVDGAIRVFDLTPEEVQRPKHGLVHSLILENKDEDFIQREPLVLNGHGQSPVRTICFEPTLQSRLASGGSDGSVVLWDIVSETGIFRLLGHRGGITDICFVRVQGMDALVTSSLDGLVKVWDLEAQCCQQTIASHRGEVLSATCQNIRASGDEEDRWRLVTGGSDGQVRVWSVQTPKRIEEANQDPAEAAKNEAEVNKDDVCHLMGYLVQPANVAKSSQKVMTVRYHPSGRYVGVLQADSKSIDVFAIRNMQETNKKRQRRLRRRQEKAKKQSEPGKEQKKGKKRGLLDDPESSSDEDQEPDLTSDQPQLVDPESIKASDEFEWISSVRCSHKVRGFGFVPGKEKGELARVACTLSTNAIETHKIFRKKDGPKSGPGAIVGDKVTAIDMYGHPTGIRAISLSSDDALACTVSKNSTKLWNVKTRSLIQSLSPAVPTSKNACYGLCTAFLPGNDHVVIGTREGHLLIVDISSGEVVFAEESAHDGAVWSIDIKRPSANDSSVAIVSGSADKTVKFWSVEEEDDDDEGSDDELQINGPVLVHQRTLQMADDVVAVRYSNTFEQSKRLVFVASLDSTIKVFFDDSLKLFLSLYGHKLPVLAFDASEDDMLLASGGADKTVKIWGLDFGDTHRTLHGHKDSITDLRFVKQTHNFFTSSKDGTIRFWDADRFQQILLLEGHTAETNCMTVNKTGAFILSGGMDRQIRVWERTKDIVFLEEERERELEQVFDNISGRNDNKTSDILDNKEEDGDGEDEADGPQSEAAVRKSITSVSSGDRVMEALEQADQELKEISLFKRNNPGKTRPPNMFMLGMEPAQYVLWVLKTVKNAELEQSILMLSMRHIERLLYYLIVLLRAARGVELCSRIGVFIVKIHQNQVVATPSLAPPLRELQKLVQVRLRQARDDVIGYNLAALRLIAKTAANQKQLNHFGPSDTVDVWAGMGLGSDLAAAAQGRPNKT